jgi:hypothetical protein
MLQDVCAYSYVLLRSSMQRLQLVVDMCTNPVRGSSQNNLQTAALTSLSCKLLHNMLMNVCLLCSHVLTQSDVTQPVPGCVGMLHNPVQAVANTTASRYQNKLPSMLPVCFGHQCTRLNVFCRSE